MNGVGRGGVSDPVRVFVSLVQLLVDAVEGQGFRVLACFWWGGWLGAFQSRAWLAYIRGATLAALYYAPW